jgi:hypothetical protein
MKASDGRPIAFSRNFRDWPGRRESCAQAAWASSRGYSAAANLAHRRSAVRHAAATSSRIAAANSRAPQHLVGMLAEHRRMPVDRGPVVVEQDGIAGGAHLAEPRMLDLAHHAAGDDLRMLEHLLEVVHSARSGTPAACSACSARRRAGCDRQARPAGSSASSLALRLRIGAKARVADMRVEPEHLQQLAEQLIVGRADRDVAQVAGSRTADRAQRAVACCRAAAARCRSRDIPPPPSAAAAIDASTSETSAMRPSPWRRRRPGSRAWQ